MKKILTSIFLCLSMLLSLTGNVLANSTSTMSDDEFLLYTGMSQEDIHALDPDIKKYIVTNLKANTHGQVVEYIASQEITTIHPRATEVLSGITFTAPAWQAGGVIHIYPTYEFTIARRPKGNDGFAFAMGDALACYDYGGQLWYKDSNGTDWISGNTLTANLQSLAGAGFTGSQLGKPDFALYIKGCTYAKANAGSGSDKRIVMNYIHNPNKYNFSLGIGYGGISVGVNANNTIYTASKTLTLSY